MVRLITLPQLTDDFEADIRNHFDDAGYFVYRGTKWLKLHKDSDKKGMPDFYMYSLQKSFLVEVKTKNDALRLSQLKWLARHPDVPVYIVYPSEKGQADLGEIPLTDNSIVEKKITQYSKTITKLRKQRDRLDKDIRELYQDISDVVGFYWEHAKWQYVPNGPARIRKLTKDEIEDKSTLYIQPTI